MKLACILALLATLGLAACTPAEATLTPAEPAATASPPAAAQPSLTPSAPPGAAPVTPAAPADPLPADTVALYAAGDWESPEVYALAASGTSTSLGLHVTPTAVASASGRWLAYFDSVKAPGRLIVRSLQDGRTHTAALKWPGAGAVMAPAFDAGETRLAFLEVGPVSREGLAWTFAVLGLEDGDVRRFETLQPVAQPALLPGYPLGWSAHDELLLDTFVPYSEGAFQGLWAFTLPATGTPAGDTLPRRELLPGGAYVSPQLSPDGSRLLYLARDRDYAPADYHTEYIDAAVNQLWSLDVASGRSTLLVEVRDGGALGSAAWSPGGDEVLYTQGRYSGNDRLGSLSLKACDGSGAQREVGPLTLPAESSLWPLRWARPGLALALVSLQGGTMELYAVDPASGGATAVAGSPYIHLLGCLP